MTPVRAELFGVVRDQVAAVLGVPEDTVTEATDLVTEYEIDSLERMEIGARLEKALRARLDPVALFEVSTVGQAVDALERMRLEPAPAGDPAVAPVEAT